LLGIYRDFGVSVRIRLLEKVYSYERSELVSALAGLLKEAKLEPALVPGVNNRFLASLVKGEIENFGCPFSGCPLWRWFDRRRENALGGVQGFS
jgi:hypothetical protein